MSVREYIGARYVPLFADPLTWDATSTYEPLTVVLYQGNSYTSRQSVPANIDITNTTYWAQTGNYNAQVEQYRQEVQAFNGRITQNATDIAAEETARQNADTALQTAITNETTARQSADTNIETSLQTAIGNETTARQNADTELNNKIIAIKQEHMVIISDSWFSTSGGTVLPPQLSNIFNIPTSRIHNYATGGSGFLRDYATPFPAQLQLAINDNSFDNSDVGYVIILGGTNDYNLGFTNVSEYVTVINSMITTVKQSFPNAKYKVFFMQGRNGRGYIHQFINSVMSSVNGNICNMSWPISFLDFADEYHPNNSGYNDVARFIGTEMLGGTFAPRYVAPLSFANYFNASTMMQSSPVSVATLQPTWNECGYRIQVEMIFNGGAKLGTVEGEFIDTPNLGIPTMPLPSNETAIAMRMATAGEPAGIPYNVIWNSPSGAGLNHGIGIRFQSEFISRGRFHGTLVGVS